MKLINTNNVYYDNDFEKWYFEYDEDFENAQVVDAGYVKENQELEQQLAEKDKEIKELKTEFDMYRSMSIQKDWNDPELIKSIRKQVCDEIRQYCKEHFKPVKDELGYIASLDRDDFYSFLEKIEKGE